VVVPAYREILEARKSQMGLNELRPWDTSVDPLGRGPLKPFDDVKDLVDKCQTIFQGVDPAIGSVFEDMARRGLLDLESRKGKAPGGYQSTLNESRKPFIFMNAVGLDGDVRTLLHEGGHAFHAFACAHYDLLDYRHAPMEFCELASMSMELLGDGFMEEFYSPEDAQRSRQEHLEGVVSVLAWVALIDAFQHQIYENPKQTIEQRRAIWLDLRKRFSADTIDWSGLEEAEANMWHRQLHIFEVPFYYIEYAIAQLGALQIWAHSMRDFAQAVGAYKKGLSLGGSRPLPELFEATNCRFDFSQATIAPLIDLGAKELS